MDVYLSKHDHPLPNLQLRWCFDMLRETCFGRVRYDGPVRFGIGQTLGKPLHLRQVAGLTYALFIKDCTTGGGFERVFILPVLGR
jgi:hypothetical protein